MDDFFFLVFTFFIIKFNILKSIFHYKNIYLIVIFYNINVLTQHYIYIYFLESMAMEKEFQI